jgi:hypothetical protein
MAALGKEDMTMRKDSSCNRLPHDRSALSFFRCNTDRLRPNIFLLLGAALIYLVLLASFSQQIAGSHPDEYGKADQILTGERNYFHPQLLLFNLELGNVFFTRNDSSELIQIGRYISNFYAAVTVFVFSTIGWSLFGRLWGWLFFVAFAANGAILVSGRYVKEDIFLCFGIAVLLLALTLDRSDTKKSGLAAVVAGLGCAIVISSKYIGIVFVVAFLVAYFYQRGPEWRVDLSKLVWPFLVATLVINYRIILNLGGFLAGFHYEFNHETSDHFGIWVGRFSDLYLQIISEIMPLTALVAIPFLLLLLRATGCRRTVVAMLIFSLGSICAYGAMIQLAPVKIPRYCFPLLVLLPFAFLISAVELWRKTKSDLHRLLVVIPGMLFIYQMVWSSMTIMGAINDDTRDQLFRYVTASPDLKNALVLSDRYSQLSLRLHAEKGPSTNPNGIRLRTVENAADACLSGECNDVDYIVIACRAFSRFFRNDVHMDANNARRREVYDRWLKEGNYLKSFGSSQEDFENRFGMYESPCIYVIRNTKVNQVKE